MRYIAIIELSDKCGFHWCNVLRRSRQRGLEC